MTLKRIGVKPNLSQAVIRGDTVYLSGQIARSGDTVRDQTIDILEQIDELLAEAGTDKSNLLSANIWLVDIGTFSEMNDVWNDWVAPGQPPARATVEAKLAAPQFLVEIMAIAAIGVSEAPAWFAEFEAALRLDAGGEESQRAEALIALSLAAGQGVTVPDEELQGAVRRALLVLAAGGDPSRGLELDGRAVETLAEDIDSPFRREELARGIAALREQAAGFPTLAEALSELLADGEFAWRAFSAARMVQAIDADQLAGD